MVFNVLVACKWESAYIWINITDVLFTKCVLKLHVKSICEFALSYYWHVAN